MPSPADSDEPPSSIQVVVANLGGVLVQLVVHLIIQQPDMVLVHQVDGVLDLLTVLSPAIDVLILGAPQATPAPAICSHLLAEFPHLRILVLATSGQAAVLYWLGLRRQTLTPVAPAALIDGIRWAYRLNATV